MKRLVLLVLVLVNMVLFSGCSETITSSPSEIVSQIEKSYGSFPLGIRFDSVAKEWEEDYLSESTIVALFGEKRLYDQMIVRGFFYLSAALDPYEEVIVLECHTSDQTRRMAEHLLSRDEALSKLEEDKIDAIITCHGRYVVYCRLSDSKRANRAIKCIDW